MLTNKLLDSLQLREVRVNKFSTLWTDQYLLALGTNHRNLFAAHNENDFLKEGVNVVIKHPLKP